MMVIHSSWQYPLSELISFSDTQSLSQMAIQLALIPTMIVVILAGGLLSVSSLLLQQIIGNTLASDTTLAVGGGGQLALLLVVLFLPSFGLYGSFWVAFIGALVSMGLVFGLSIKAKLDPVVLILSGLVINILFYALANLLLIFFSESAMGVMLWSGGALTQTSWDNVGVLIITTFVLSVLLIPLIKPLTLMTLDDITAKSLGVPVLRIRVFVVMLVALVVAVVVSRLGVLSFTGLAGATLANALAIRYLVSRLLIGFITGGLLLWLTSNVVVLLSEYVSFNIPAGAMTGVLGAPLIIYLILNQTNQITHEDKSVPVSYKHELSLPLVCLLMVSVFVVVLIYAPSATGSFGIDMRSQMIYEFRLSRTLGAMAVGAMLAVAGTLLQKLTHNPMASPEVLGVSSGAALGVLLSFVLLPTLGLGGSLLGMVMGGVLGALVVLVVILWLSSQLSSGYLLLIGVAISALMTGMLTLIRLSGDPRLQAVLTWLSGTTYHIKMPFAIVLIMISAITLIIALIFTKPLALISLGSTIAQGRGVSVRAYQGAILLLVAVLSAVSTLAVGPLSFIGLIIPHLATSLGAVRLSSQLIVAAILGATLLMLADWVGRYIIFPYEIPAGTLAAILGAVYFMYLVYRTKKD